MEEKEQKFKVNTEKLKNETAETVKKVKETIKRVNDLYSIKEEELEQLNIKDYYKSEWH